MCTVVSTRTRTHNTILLSLLKKKGKSQFLNTITSTTISAVSRKRHTTRNGILATHNKDNTQIVFIDTPGFVQYSSPKDETLFRDLVRGASESMDRADFTLVVLDAARKIQDELREELALLMLAAHHSQGRIEDITVNDDGEVEEVVTDEDEVRSKLRSERERFAIVLNKVDLVNPKEKLLDIAEDIGSLGDACVRYRGEELNDDDDDDDEKSSTIVKNQNQFDPLSPEEEEKFVKQYPPVFFISALEDDGLDDIMEYLYSLASPTKNFVLPPNQKTTMSLPERIEEIIREKLYRCLHREVPHSITQINRVLKKGKTRNGRQVLRIDQDIVVRTKSHHKLVLGRGGMTLKRIEDTARRDLVKILGSEGYDEIYLTLNVKHSKSNPHERDLEADRQGVIRKVF